MKCYIFRFKQEKNAKFIFKILALNSNKKIFRFCKDNKHYIAIYCTGITAVTLQTLLSYGLEHLKSELIPDFGYFCELEKAQVLEMCNV